MEFSNTNLGFIVPFLVVVISILWAVFYTSKKNIEIRKLNHRISKNDQYNEAVEKFINKKLLDQFNSTQANHKLMIESMQNKINSIESSHEDDDQSKLIHAELVKDLKGLYENILENEKKQLEQEKDRLDRAFEEFKEKFHS